MTNLASWKTVVSFLANFFIESTQKLLYNQNSHVITSPPVGRFVVFVMYSQHFQWTFIAEKKDHYTYTIAMYKPPKKTTKQPGATW